MILKPGKFNNIYEYHTLIEQLERSKEWVETPVGKTASNVGLLERWFQLVSSGTVWRIVEPDAPYPGLCERVESE